METTIFQRIRCIIDFLEISDRKFSERINIPSTTLSNYFKRGSEPGYYFLKQIVDSIEFINARWLLTGKGEMIDCTVELKSGLNERENYLFIENQHLKTSNDLNQTFLRMMENNISNIKNLAQSNNNLEMINKLIELTKSNTLLEIELTKYKKDENKEINIAASPKENYGK